MSRRSIHTLIFHYSTLVLAAVIPFSPKLCTWCIIVMAINWLWEGKLVRKLKTTFRNKFAFLCMLFFLLETTGLLYTHYFNEGLYHLQKEASFLVIPLLYFSYFSINKKLKDKSLVVFCLSVFLTSLYCIIIGLANFLKTDDISFLFYHTLVAPVHQHAVYFSIYVFICIVYLFFLLKKPASVRRVIFILLLLAYFSTLLFLLRSKMVISVSLLYAVCQMIINIRQHRQWTNRKILFPLCFILGILVVFNTSNPFSNQTYELKDTNLKVLSTSRFEQGDYFNEVELRLLLWKFTFQILNENRGWLLGVSPGDAQARINQKIIGYNMYTGVPGTEDHGFLNYNVHNQYLETLLRSGLTGLFLLVWILWRIFKKALRAKNEVLMSVLFVFVSVFFTESVFEREFGIVSFFFFICLLWPSRKQISKNKKRTTNKFQSLKYQTMSPP